MDKGLARRGVEGISPSSMPLTGFSVFKLLGPVYLQPSWPAPALLCYPLNKVLQLMKEKANCIGGKVSV